MNIRRCLCFLAILFFGALFQSETLALCKPQQNRFSNKHKKAVDEAVELQMKQQELIGVAVGIISNKKIVYVKAYGMADREKEIECSTDSMFRWASISKPVTAFAALQLVEAGKLKLDDDVRKYVPEFRETKDMITVRHLLCHQSGIVHYRNGKVVPTVREYENKNPFEDVVLAVDKFNKSPLVHKPGAKYSYSSHAYILLSAVVQRAGEQKFADQVAERISKPLGLTTLQPDYQWKEIPNRVVGYRKSALGPLPKLSSNTDVSWKLGGGGFISNIDDLTRFGQCLIKRELLSKKTYEAMWTRQTLADGKESSIGLGLFVDGSGESLKISHSGAQEKTRTRLVTYPNRGDGIAVMTNSEQGDPGRITTAIYGALSKVK